MNSLAKVAPSIFRLQLIVVVGVGGGWGSRGLL